ncbi:hypothetical protein HMPREF1544_10047 [Mucor circinelloides 1006PhL]|uniref:Reverse transcriptase RNase H-like domain-containing protein n=1 Tax=Mucor circinelloides f. circinelloides (strain 1006PhL) TaxID=1220926 RepID=S2J0U2_MUCC1|nr:hypothetical protein HMPREF1544_10047 [Mucor circinelloides 1006PhL]
MKTHGYWTEEEKQWSINVKELMAIYFALKLHAPNFRNKTIKIFTDNTTSIKYTTKAGGTASLLLQEIAIKIQELCNKNIEHRSRYLIEKTGTGIREKPPQETSKGIETDMGSNTSGHICEQTQPTIPPVLQLETGRGSPGGGCLPADLAEEDGLLLPSMETDTQGPSTHQSTAVRKGGPYHAKLDNLVLVSNDDGDETPNTTKDLPLSISEVSRLALIRQAIQTQGLGEEEATYISESTRGSTSKIYDNGWKNGLNGAKQEGSIVKTTTSSTM